MIFFFHLHLVFQQVIPLLLGFEFGTSICDVICDVLNLTWLSRRNQKGKLIHLGLKEAQQKLKLRFWWRFSDNIQQAY